MNTQILMLSLLCACLPTIAQAQPPAVNISTEEQIKEEFTFVPCKNGERLNAVRALFEKLGAPPAEITTDKYKNVENIVVRKQGLTDEVLVVGAHFDKSADGCGAIDNWSGIVAVAHLYKTVKDLPTTKTILFVGFGKEEDGLVGSRAMADAIPKEQLGKYCAMVNIDSLGLTVPQVADNLSSRKLTDFAVALAKEMQIQFAHAAINGAGADSQSFVNRRIPALTIHGLSSQWPSVLHSSSDQAKKVNTAFVYLGYRFALALTARLDEAECQAVSEQKPKDKGKQ